MAPTCELHVPAGQLLPRTTQLFTSNTQKEVFDHVYSLNLSFFTAISYCNHQQNQPIWPTTYDHHHCAVRQVLAFAACRRWLQLPAGHLWQVPPAPQVPSAQGKQGAPGVGRPRPPGQPVPGSAAGSASARRCSRWTQPGSESTGSTRLHLGIQARVAVVVLELMETDQFGAKDDVPHGSSGMSSDSDLCLHQRPVPEVGTFIFHQVGERFFLNLASSSTESTSLTLTPAPSDVRKHFWQRVMALSAL